jgi:hypothetical protein
LLHKLWSPEHLWNNGTIVEFYFQWKYPIKIQENNIFRKPKPKRAILARRYTLKEIVKGVL